MPARLVTVRRDQLEIRRVRRGKAWSYLDAAGGRLRDPRFRARVASLAIPPAWHDVRIALSDRAHLQCFGRDEKGRGQYIYHPEWEQRRAQKKQKRLALLTGALPRVRRQISKGLEAEAGSAELATAIALALIDRTAMRVGRERYLKANGTRGAGTLYSRDVQVSGETVEMAFDAKGGKRARYIIADPHLAAAISRIKSLPHRRLLVFYDEEGRVRPLRSEMINAYLRKAAQAAVTAKDFRTLHASALAAEALAAQEPAETELARKRQVAAVTRDVAEFLRNTPTICRKSYIAPCLFSLFDQGRLKELWLSPGPAAIGMRKRERQLGAVLAAVR